MRKLIYLLIFSAALANAQTTIVVPAPDGTTIKSTNNIWSCIQQGGPTVAYANGVLTVNGVQVNVLSLTQLNLTGSTAYANGQYLSTFTNGALTWTPYVPPTNGTPGKVYTVAIPQQAGWSLNWYPVPGAVVTPGQVFAVSPVFSGAPPTTLNYFMETLFVNAAGAVYIRVANGTGNVFAASTATVTIR